MSGTKARTVRSFLTTLLVVSGLALTSSLYAETRDKPEGRGRDDRESKQVQRPANSRNSAPANATRPTVQPSRPGRPADQARAVQPAPVSPQRARPGQRPAPVDQGGFRVSPQPARDDRVWQRQQRATPYKQYSAPEQRTSPQAPQRIQRPVRQDNPRSQRQRVDTERPTRAPDQSAEPQRTPAVQNRFRADRPRDQQPVRRPAADRPARPTAAPGATGRVQGVPEARFRGPEADRDVRIVRPEERQRVPQELRNRLREQNRNAPRPIRGRPKVDVIGNPVSTDTTFIVRDNISRISIGYHRVRQTCGDPTFYYVFAPRHPHDYWDGYWNGYTDGYEAGRHHFHGHHVVVSFYYGYYWSDPLWFAFYYPGYYPAIYTYWGWSPGWIYPDRCYYAPAEYVYAPATPYRYYGSDYYVDERGADRALDDIRRAWYDGDISAFAYHLTDDVDIRVYFDGEYQYSTTTEDYYAMTADAMSTTQTTSLNFDQPIWLSTSEFFVTGRHEFYDPNGDQQTVYISYRLRKLGGEWYIVSVGSSLEPIQHQYNDFRY